MAISKVALGDIAMLINGRAFAPKDWGKDGLPIIRIQNLNNPSAPVDRYSGAVAPEHLVKNGDLLLSWSASLDAYVWSGSDAVLNQHIFKVVPNIQRVTSSYLFLLLKAAMESIRARIHGATMKHVRKGELEKMLLPLPPLAQQESVAARLFAAIDEANTASRAVRAGVETAAALKRAILSEEFPAPTAIYAPPTKVLPRSGWVQYRLQDIARLESGHTPSRRQPDWWGGNVPWLSLPDIRRLHGKYAHQTAEYTNDAGIANSSARLLPPGTVCVSRTASIGFVTMLARPMATSQDFCNWICNPEKLDSEFLMYAFMASQEHLRQLGSGAVHKTIYMPTIECFHICAPELAEQRRIAVTLRHRLAAAEALHDSLRSRFSQIEQLPDRILAAAFPAF